MPKTTRIVDVDYKPVRKNPLDWNRNSTHTVFIVLFVAVAIGCGITFYVQYSDNNEAVDTYWHFENKEKYEYALNLYKLKCTIRNFAVGAMDYYLNDEGVMAIAMFSSFAGVVMLTFLLIIRWIPKISTAFGIFIASLCIILFILIVYLDIRIFYEAFESNGYHAEFFSDERFYFAQDLARLITLLTVIIGCISQVGFYTIVDTIKTSLRAMFFFPSLILFGIFILILNVLVVRFMYSPIWNSTQQKSLYYITILASIYAHLCIYYFGKMVISQTIATWYWTESKEEIPKFAVLRSIAIICRYHLGAVFFAATGILPLIVAIAVACRHKFHAAPTSGNWVVQIILKIFLIFNIADYALIITSAYGYNFFQATKKTFELMIKRSSLSLAVIYLFYVLLIFGGFVAFLLDAILESVTNVTDIPVIDYNGFKTSIHLSSLLVISLLAHIFILSESAVHATLLCTVEDNDNNNEPDEKKSLPPPYEMIKV